MKPFVCAGHPRGLVLKAFLQQASVFESYLEFKLLTPRNARICVPHPGIFAIQKPISVVESP